jgi:hypothetical protein
MKVRHNRCARMAGMAEWTAKLKTQQSRESPVPRLCSPRASFCAASAGSCRIIVLGIRFYASEFFASGSSSGKAVIRSFAAA